jgi:hypothetical protein
MFMTAAKALTISRFNRRWTLAATLLVLLGGMGAAPPAHLKEHVIRVDATALTPPTRWYVPGITPIIWSLDPESTEALRTTDPYDLKLKPGKYRFGTFTFDFPFVVTLEGVLDFAPTLDACVQGRGTQTLTVRCSQTMPYVGQTDYWKPDSTKKQKENE